MTEKMINDSGAGEGLHAVLSEIPSACEAKRELSG